MDEQTGEMFYPSCQPRLTDDRINVDPMLWEASCVERVLILVAITAVDEKLGPMVVPPGETPRCHPMTVRFDASEQPAPEDDWMEQAFGKTD
jgi:hypothetical protein